MTPRIVKVATSRDPLRDVLGRVCTRVDVLRLAGRDRGAEGWVSRQVLERQDVRMDPSQIEPPKPMHRSEEGTVDRHPPGGADKWLDDCGSKSTQPQPSCEPPSARSAQMLREVLDGATYHAVAR